MSQTAWEGGEGQLFQTVVSERAAYLSRALRQPVGKEEITRETRNSSKRNETKIQHTNNYGMKQKQSSEGDL